MYTDDPERDFLRHDAEQQAWLEKRPVCHYCGEHIQDEYAVRIDGHWICKECIDDFTEYIEED